MNVDGDGDQDLRDLNHQLYSGSKRVKDVVVAKEQDVGADDGFKINVTAENVKDGSGGALQAPSMLQVVPQQQQSQGTIVCWERFLHLRSLKVLLVENDDCTRHVVTALLRNCSYEVVEAANGLQAWKILEDLTNHIDLILTEVVMPCLSGIGLLYKIMNHKTRRNVPIIMMSSRDSMGLVFECLSKGAVDFLVKPIRKNELKNLWQHVWRRCHSSSGSGSESGTQTQKSVKSKSVEKLYNTGSNDEDDDASNGLNVGDGSDNGSGTQSSWTKQAAEVDSSQPVSPWDQVAECPDSTCAQVIHSNAEISAKKQIMVVTANECQEHEEKLDSLALDKDPAMGEKRKLCVQLDYQDPSELLSMKQNNLPDKGSGNFTEKIEKEQLDLNSESPPSKLKYEATNMTCATNKTTNANSDIIEYEAQNRLSKTSDVKNRAITGAKEIPSPELPLKRLRGVKDVETTVQEDRIVLRHSDSSAFSRYNTALSSNMAHAGNRKIGSPWDSSLDITKRGTACDLQSRSNGDHRNQCSIVGSNNVDMVSTTNNTFTKPIVIKNKSAVTSTVKCLHPPTTFQPTKGDVFCVSEKADDIAGTAMLAQSRGAHQEQQAQCHHYDDHHCHHLLHNVQLQQQPQQHRPLDHDASSFNKMAATVPYCGLSNMFGGPVEGNAGNYSVNGSASGSNHGSNGQNGSSIAANAGGNNIESDNGVAGKSGSGDATGSGSGSGNKIDQNKLAQREAALTKFRQKRKERCFRKKVRYQSRKRLAEQRPRFRGQFVRQTSNENTSRGTDG